MAGSISTLGVGSGLQLQDILDKLRAVDQGVVDRKKTDVAKFQSQLDEFTVVNNKLLTLKSSALTLSLAGTFIGRTVSSSSESSVSATVTDGAIVKSSALTVDNLAKKSSWVSSGVLDPALTPVVSGATAQGLTIGMAGKTFTVTVDPETTMNQLAEQINGASDNTGLTATVINDGLDSAHPYKLVLTANSYGEGSRITIDPGSQLSELPFTVQGGQADQNSLNAQFSVDGVAYQRQSNTISDVVTGVSLTLKGKGESSITVANNNDQLKETITGLVTAFNDVVQEIKEKSAYDAETGSFGVLRGTTLRDLSYELQGLMSSVSSNTYSGKIKSLFDLGLELNRDGSITINDATLTSALDDHGDDVQAFFIGDSANDIEGFADTINNRLRSLTSVSGTIAGEKSAVQARVNDLNLKFEEETARLNKKYDLLTKQFVALDSYMNEMTSMSNFLTGQFNNLSDGWSGTGSSK
ncbi:MAG: flagellar filament capping protein FliD [Desulfobulbaceae bacterium]|nr:flagellar filament capping protein FliD [Desulfobulbaceae bacterium]